MIKVNIRRGGQVESVHEIKALILNSKGKILFSTGHDKDVIYPRSAIKIFQSMPLVLSGSHNFFNLSDKQIALSASSHFGEPNHISALNNWLKKINVKENCLKCGVHNPLNLKFSNKLLLSNKKPTPIYNNCSGKHLGMITASKFNNYSIKNYTNFNHPIQKSILSILEDFNEYKIHNKLKAIDGCSAPQYAFPLENLALSMFKISRLHKLRLDISFSLNRILNCISHYPFYIGGTGRLDSQIINITKGRIFCKIGAEGVLMFADMNNHFGGILKVIDGNQRALPSATIKLLKKIKSINAKEYEKLNKLQSGILKNHSNVKIGKIDCKIL